MGGLPAGAARRPSRGLAERQGQSRRVGGLSRWCWEPAVRSSPMRSGSYEVFARSPTFYVYTVSASRPTAVLSGGLAVVPRLLVGRRRRGLHARTGRGRGPGRGRPERQEGSAAARVDRSPGRPGGTPAGRATAPGCSQPRACLTVAGPLLALVGHQVGLERSRPQVDWVRGQRYVQDGTPTTTAGVTSGVFGALRLVEQLAGAGEAERVGQALAYPLVAARPHRDPRAALGARRSGVPAGCGLPVAANGRRRPGRGVGELQVAALEVYGSLRGSAPS